MDDLAGELGMSKKTLYAHVPGKELIVSAIMESKIREIRTGMHAIVEDASIPVMDRAHRMMAFIVRQMSEISPAFLRDLERHHPALYARMESVRAEILPRSGASCSPMAPRRGSSAAISIRPSSPR
jgi:AcrR family transcriptional regulator